jgi:hypothetical protein
MARPLRVVVPGAWYHVMARGIERRTIYSDEGSRKLFIHLNPVRVKRFGASRCDDKGPSADQMVEMVKELTEFKWSSYRSYAGYTPAPKWLCTEAGDLGTSWKESLAGDLVLGGEDFVERVRKTLVGNSNERTPSGNVVGLISFRERINYFRALYSRLCLVNQETSCDTVRRKNKAAIRQRKNFDRR